MIFLKKLEHKFIGYNTLWGNRIFSLNIFYSLLWKLKEKYKIYPYLVFLQVYKNLSPPIILQKKTNRRGQVIKEIPFRITVSKRLTIFLLWTLRELKGKIKRKVFFYNLLRSIFNIYELKGSAFLKKKELYKRSVVGKFNIVYFKS